MREKLTSITIRVILVVVTVRVIVVVVVVVGGGGGVGDTTVEQYSSGVLAVPLEVF